MDSNINIEQFSRDLILDVLDLIPKDLPVEIEELPVRKYMSVVVPAVEHFTDEFFREFEAVFNISYDAILDSEADFIQYVTMCCSNLCGDCTYLQFLLICAFILELLNYSTYKRQCFRFMETASVCLVAVFNKHFKANFFDQGGWSGLKSFCENVARSRNEKDWLNALTGDTECMENLFDLIAECANKPDCNLARYERTEMPAHQLLNNSESDTSSTSVMVPETPRTPERKKLLTLPIMSFNAPRSSTTDYPRFTEASCSSSSHVKLDNASVSSSVVSQFAKLTTAERKKNFTLPLLHLTKANPSVIKDRASAHVNSTSPSSSSKNINIDDHDDRRKCVWCGCACYNYIKMCQEQYKEKHLQLIEAEKEKLN